MCGRESLNLVGAEMAVRIETDGQSDGVRRRQQAADRRRRAGIARRRRASQPAGVPPPGPRARRARSDIAGVLTWIDGLGATGLDGHDLRELGLKNGNLIVDDQRNGKRWTFSTSISA